MSKKNKKALIFLIIIGIIVLFVVLIASKFSSAIQLNNPTNNQISAIEISGNSMDPNYKEGQFYLAKVINLENSVINRGDVVAYRNPEDNKLFIKKVVGLPGDSIQINGGSVYINGEQLEEEYTNGTETQAGEFIDEGEIIEVPEGSYFILGDNRPYSYDCRNHGFVSIDGIESRLTKCYRNCE